MAKSKNLKDKEKYKIIEEELRKFNNLIEGHKELLAAMGKL